MAEFEVDEHGQRVPAGEPAAEGVLTEEEALMLRFATTSLVPMERLELLHYLGYPEDLPIGTEARVKAVVKQILKNRGHEGVPT